MKAYIAGPLFTYAERSWNADLAFALREYGHEVTLPQEGAAKMLAATEPFDPHELFHSAIKGVENCEVVIAILDGADPDSGTCWECGFAWQLGRPIVGVRTDLRPGGDDGGRPVNLMLAQSCAHFVIADKAEANMDAIAKAIHECLQNL